MIKNLVFKIIYNFKPSCSHWMISNLLLPLCLNSEASCAVISSKCEFIDITQNRLNKHSDFGLIIYLENLKGGLKIFKMFLVVVGINEKHTSVY